VVTVISDFEEDCSTTVEVRRFPPLEEFKTSAPYHLMFLEPGAVIEKSLTLKVHSLTTSMVPEHEYPSTRYCLTILPDFPPLGVLLVSQAPLVIGQYWA